MMPRSTLKNVMPKLYLVVLLMAVLCFTASMQEDTEEEEDEEDEKKPPKKLLACGDCFPGTAIVMTSTGERRPMSELNVGDSVLSWDQSGSRLGYSEVIAFLHRESAAPDVNRTAEFVELTTRGGRVLQLTPYHLIPLAGNMTTVKDGNMAERFAFAREVSVGAVLLVAAREDATEGESVTRDVVASVRVLQRHLSVGLYAPTTTAGTIVVDGVVASCYAVVDSHVLAHWALTPLRLYRLVTKSLLDAWAHVNGGDATAELEEDKTGPNVHWYADMLQTLGSTVLPAERFCGAAV